MRNERRVRLLSADSLPILIHPVVDKAHAKEHQAEEQRLGHRCGLQVQHIRLCCEDRHAECCRDARTCHGQNEPRDRVTRQRKGDQRDRDARCPGPVERVNLNGKKIQQMWKRQPDSPDLGILWRQTIESHDAPRPDAPSHRSG